MNLGLLGYGRWGKNVARALARVGDLAVIADPNPDRQIEARHDWSGWGTHVVSEMDVAFRACDAVWVATPTADHYDTVKAALDAGCHVLVEKPVVRDPQEAQWLVTFAEQRNLALMGGFLGLFTGSHRALEALPTAGVSGIEIARHNTAASLSDGDVLWGLGPHDVASVVQWLGGVPDRFGPAHGTQHRVEASVGFGDITVHFTWDWLAEERARRVRVFWGNHWQEFGAAPANQEPLLAEAQHFVTLPADDESRVEAYKQILDVTNTLHGIHLSAGWR